MARGRPSKKQHILTTASQLFALHGYQGTSIDLVVKEAAVSKPTIYNNFPSKQSLLQALLTTETVNINKKYQEIEKDTQSKITDKLFAGFSLVIDTPFYLSVFKMYFGEQQKLDEQSCTLCQQFDQQLHLFTQNILAHTNLSAQKKFIVEAIFRQMLLSNALTKQPLTCPNDIALMLEAIDLNLTSV